MSENFDGRLNRIASEIFPDQFQMEARGENYFVFHVTGKSALPPMWIDSGTSDQQIKEKLSREYEQALHPESSPDDASVPTLRTEGKVA